MTRFQRFIRPARPPAEESIKLLVRHAQAAWKIEIFQIQPERPVGTQIDQVFVNRWNKSRLAIGRQTHQFVFAGIDPKSAVGSERRVKQSQRMRKTQLLEYLEAIRLPLSNGGRRILTHPIHGEDRRLAERRRVKSAGGVGLMVLCKKNFAPVGQPGHFFTDRVSNI